MSSFPSSRDLVPCRRSVRERTIGSTTEEDHMRALVVYESMYGNTHAIADHVATGLRRRFDDVEVVAAGETTPDATDGVDLVVVGGPTHIHGMPRPTTRKSALDA